MTITDIQQQKNNAARYSVFIDGDYSFSLHVDDVLETQIKKGDALTNPELEALQKLSEDSLLYTKAINKCLRRLHSTHEIDQYLLQNKAPAELRDSIIAKLTDKKLLDDTEFTVHWVVMRRRRNKSDAFIRGELRQKGIELELISQCLVPEEASTQTRLDNLIKQKSHKYSDDKKLITYLQSKGFRYSEIKEALSNSED